jgi:hypothetical protein
MVLDGKPNIRSRWAALGGELWLGDISKNSQGVRVQDVRVSGIPPENAQAAIRLVGARPPRVLSESHKAALAASNVAHRFKPDGSKSHPQDVL